MKHLLFALLIWASCNTTVYGDDSHQFDGRHPRTQPPLYDNPMADPFYDPFNDPRFPQPRPMPMPPMRQLEPIPDMHPSPGPSTQYPGPQGQNCTYWPRGQGGIPQVLCR
jgi:hypothetical protein